MTMTSPLSPGRRLPSKAVLLSLALLALAASLATLVWFVGRKSRPQILTAPQAKAWIASYLKSRTGRSEFRPSFDPSQAGAKSPWDALKPAYDAPPDYPSVYRAIGEHLVVAEQYLNSTNSRHVLHGMKIIAGLADVSNEIAYDPRLGARICDAHLLPNLDLLDTANRPGLTKEQLLMAAIRAYRHADEDENVIVVSKRYLTEYPDGPRAGDVRERLRHLLRQKGRGKEAEAFFDGLKPERRK